MLTPSLCAALGGMLAIPQWFVWRLTWVPSEAKFNKVPCDPGGSMYPITAKDPANWHTYQAASQVLQTLRARADGFQYTMGFYLTKNAGYWFLDSDKCVVGDGVNDITQWLYGQLPGAAFEYSSSGAGVHFFGRGQVPIDHGCTNKLQGLELYTELRGIAFGFGEGWGSADSDHSSALWHVIVPQLFPPLVPGFADGDDDLGDGPRDDWRGPKDDDDLIRRACNAVSSAAMFGQRASFADLFHGDWEKLHAAYRGPGGEYDESAADMALSQHLAFWTGCDAARMERIMRRSALVRPKWDEHKNYLRKISISKSIKLQGDVCQDREAEPARVVIKEDVSAPVVHEITGNTFLDLEAQKERFAGCVYVRNLNVVYVPGPHGHTMMPQSVFNIEFGGASFVIDNRNDAGSVSKHAWDAFTNSRLYKCPKVDNTVFMPQHEPGAIIKLAGKDYINTFYRPLVLRAAGDITPLLNHIAKMLPDKRDQQILIAYMAACVQYQGHKFTWCPVIQGTPGNGKSTISECLVYAIGAELTHAPVAQDVGGQFNDWLFEKTLIIVNDMHIPKQNQSMVETLKPMITESRLNIEGKGEKKRMRGICANWLINMNDRGGIRKDPNDRRFGIFFTAQQNKADLLRDGMNHDYFMGPDGIVTWLHKGGFAIVAEFLHTYEIPHAYSPLGELSTAPDTSTSDQVMRESIGSIEEEIEQAIAEERKGFRGGWLCWSRLRELVEGLRRGQIKLRKLEQIIEDMGYIPHPKLGEHGLVDHRIAEEDNKRVRLYVKADHSTIYSNSSRSQIADMYVQDNSDNFFSSRRFTIVGE